MKLLIHISFFSNVIPTILLGFFCYFLSSILYTTTINNNNIYLIIV